MPTSSKLSESDARVDHAVMVVPPDTSAVAAVPARRLGEYAPATWRERFLDLIRYTRGRGALEIGLIVLVVVIGFCVASIVDPVDFPFLDPGNLAGVVFQSIPVFAILAVGTGILMVAGEFDLSLGANYGLSAIVFINVTNATSNWFLGALACLATAVAVCLVNGLVVITTRIPSFIATLGLGFFWTGVSYFINNLNAANLTPNTSATAVFTGSVGIFKMQLVWMLLVGIVAWFFLHRHKAGNAIFAVGGNASAARAISINPARVKLLAFGVLGVTIAIATMLDAVRTGQMQPGTTADYTLMSVAGAVVGGCSLNGGRGSVTGMIVGAALIQLIQDGLTLANTPGFYIQLFVGLLIVVAAVANKFFEGKAQ